MNNMLFYHNLAHLCVYFLWVTCSRWRSHCCGVFERQLSEISCQSDSVGVHTVLYVDSLLMKVSVGVTTLCLFSHVGFHCCHVFLFQINRCWCSNSSANQMFRFREQVKGWIRSAFTVSEHFLYEHVAHYKSTLAK